MSAVVGICGGKRRYERRCDAVDAVSGLRNRKRDGAKTNVYHCGACGGYHFGRDPNGGRNEKQRMKAAWRAHRELRRFEEEAFAF